jgi:hypothetical protein
MSDHLHTQAAKQTEKKPLPQLSGGGVGWVSDTALLAKKESLAQRNFVWLSTLVSSSFKIGETSTASSLNRDSSKFDSLLRKTQSQKPGQYIMAIINGHETEDRKIQQLEEKQRAEQNRRLKELGSIHRI